jgi:hypothetical protein
MGSALDIGQSNQSQNQENNCHDFSSYNYLKVGLESLKSDFEVNILMRSLPRLVT